MNYKLLQNHIDVNIKVSSIPEMKPDGSNVKDFFCADVIGNRRFAQNYGGYHRSDIAEINAATNLDVQKQLLSQLEDYSSANNQNAGLSDIEISLGHRSKYCQMPTEMQLWLQSQLEIRDAKRSAALRTAQAAQKKNNIDFTETEATTASP